MPDQRKFERFDLEIPARVAAETSSQNSEIFSLKTANISSGGAFFPTPKPLPIGKQVRLNLDLGVEKLQKFIGSQCRINVKGTVVRSEETGMAIRFQQNYKIRPIKSFLHLETSTQSIS